MKCKNHPTRNAEKYCASCNIPICDACAEEGNSGQYFCFNCAMLQTVSTVGGSLADQKTRIQEKKYKKKKMVWGPFQYFVVVSCVLISVMWGVILFGGSEAPGQKLDFSEKKGRVLLFMVDSAIKRYHHYENNTYPDKLADLAPEYLPMTTEDLTYLDRLSYKKDTESGYRLSLADVEPGNMSIIMSSEGMVTAVKEAD